MLHYMTMGGPLMWAILACSVAALALAAHKGVQLWRVRAAFMSDPTLERLLELAPTGARNADMAVYELARGLGSLSLIASVTPLLGLTGTVLGMIGTFQAIGPGGEVSTGLLANGVWEALLTTAAGLLVAIPAQVAHHYLSRMLDDIEAACHPARSGD